MTQALPVSLLRSLAMKLRDIITECWKVADGSQSIPVVVCVDSYYLRLSSRIHSEILSVTLGSDSEGLRGIMPGYCEALKLMNEAADAVQALTFYARKHLPQAEAEWLKDLPRSFHEDMAILAKTFSHLNEAHLLIQEHFDLSMRVYETNFSDSGQLRNKELRRVWIKKRDERFASLRKALDEYFLRPSDAGLDAYIEQAELTGWLEGGFLAQAQVDRKLAERTISAFDRVVAASLMRTESAIATSTQP